MSANPSSVQLPWRVLALPGRLGEIRRGLPETYWIVWLGTLINRLGGFVGPLLTFYLVDERGLSLAAAGGIVSLHGAGGALAGLLGGALADRLGRRATLLLSLVGGAVAMLSLGLQREPVWIALNAFALGLVGELYRPAVMAFVSDVVEPAQRLRAFGYLYWVINLAFAFAALLGGVLARWSYTALFVADALTMLAYAALIAARLPETRPARAAGAAREPLAAALFGALVDRTFLIFWLLSFGLALIFVQSVMPLAAHLAAQGHSAATFGALLALNGVLIVLLQPAASARTAPLDRSRVLAFAAVLSGVGFALHGASSWLLVHVAAIALWTLGEIIASPIHSTVVAGLSTPEARGRYQGAFGMSWSLAAMLGPLLGSALLERAGTGALWGGCLALGLALAAGYLMTAAGRRARGA